jgi:hypothetical protein
MRNCASHRPLNGPGGQGLVYDSQRKFLFFKEC